MPCGTYKPARASPGEAAPRRRQRARVGPSTRPRRSRAQASGEHSVSLAGWAIKIFSLPDGPDIGAFAQHLLPFSLSFVAGREELPWALVIGGGGAELVAALRRPGFMAYGLGPICRHDARDDLLILFDLSIEEHVNKFSRLRARCGPS